MPSSRSVGGVDGLAPYVDHVEKIGARRGLDLRHHPIRIADMSEVVDAIRQGADAGVVWVGRSQRLIGPLR